MEETFTLKIRTPNDNVFEGEATGITFTSEGGDMEVFANHASITATIAFSPLIVKTGNKEETYMARNGLFLFNNENNTATLLALHCEHKSEVNHQTIKEYAEFIDQQLKEGKELSDFQVLYLKGEKVAIEEQLEELD